MKRTPVVMTAAFLSATLALATLAPPANAAAPGVPRMSWDKKCMTLTMTGDSDGADLGGNKAELMTGMCPGGTVIARGNCWA